MLLGKVWKTATAILSLLVTVILGYAMVVTKQKNKAKQQADIANQKIKVAKAVHNKTTKVSKAQSEARKEAQEKLHEADKRPSTKRPDGDFR